MLQYVLAELGERAEEAGAMVSQLALLANHKSVGITILAAAVLRLLWRWRSPPPPLPATTPAWQAVAAHVIHWALYACLFLLPLSGWLMSSASAYSVSWFNLLSLPDLVEPDKNLVTQLKLVHETLAGTLFVLALIHIGAALKHAVVDRDDILQRMLSPVPLAASIILCGAGLVFLTPQPKTVEAAAEAVQAATPQFAETTSTVDESNPLWPIDYEASHIKFVGTQAGASFTGTWLDWRADVRFDPERLGTSSAKVVIQTAAVSSNDDERDSTIRGAEFFDAANFPQAVFSATTFRRVADGFEANGMLQIKAVQLPLLFFFDVSEDQGATVLEGRATIDRLAFNVGLGDWQDTTWVGQNVVVNVILKTISK